MDEYTEADRHRELAPSQWLRTAEDDRRASECLAATGHWPQAVFFLQQSVEKAGKALALLFGTATGAAFPKRLRHDLLRVVQAVSGKDALDRVVGAAPSGEETPQWAIESFARAQEASSRADAFIKQFRATHPPGAAMTLGEVDQLVGAIARYRAAGKKMAAVRLRVILPELLTALGDGGRVIAGELASAFPEPAKRRANERRLARMLLRVFRHIHSSWMLAPMCLIFDAHAIEPRYGRRGIEPREIYDSSHPLVVRFFVLLDIQAHIVISLRKLTNALEEETAKRE